MKTLLSIILLSLISISVSAQVYLPPQDFYGDVFPPEGWTIENGGDDGTFIQGPPPYTFDTASAIIINSANIEVDDRIISPEFNLPADTEFKLYAQLRGSVGYAIQQYWDPDNKVRYFIEISTDGGTSWEVVLDLDDSESVQAAGVSFPWPDWAWFDVAIDISSYGGNNVMIAFHHEKESVPSGGGNFAVTNMGVWEDVQNDVQLQSLDMPHYKLINNEFEVGGMIKNIGNNEVNSFEGTIYVNGESVQTYTITGLSLASFDTHSFTAGDILLLDEVDIYSIELVVDLVNSQPDASPENNSLSQEISIGSSLVDRIPLFEMFTSSTCPTCPGGNEILDNILGNNPDSTYSLVKYQVDWPGNGDPYYIEDGGIRTDYYTISGVPSLVTNGIKKFSSYDFTQTKFNQAKAEESFVALDLQHDFDGLFATAYLDVDPKINIEDASVHIAVVEKTTYNNTGTNGETQFKNVLMAMIPDGYGTSTTLTNGSSEMFSGDANLLTSFVEEYEDLMIVAWVQDNQTGVVLQSASHDLYLTTAVAEKESHSVSIFPNPTSGPVQIVGVQHAQVVIRDISGKEVYREVAGTQSISVSLEEYGSGVYFVSIVHEGVISHVEKIIVE